MDHSNETLYCNILEFVDNYDAVTGYFNLFVCIFGLITNVFNICLLTKCGMRITTNFILTGLAVSDLLMLLVYIPSMLHWQLENPKPYFSSYPWTVYNYFSLLFSQTLCYLNSFCLIGILGLWQYIALNNKQMFKIWCNLYRTKLAMCAFFVLCLFICAPTVFMLDISSANREVYLNGTIKDYTVDFNADVPVEHRIMYFIENKNEHIYFWIYRVVLTLILCSLFTLLLVMLVISLRNAKRRWKNNIQLVNTMDQQRLDCENEQQLYTTTRILIIVILLLLMPELPQAAMGLFTAAMSTFFRYYCYYPLDSLLRVIIHVRPSFTFIVYYKMSVQFRRAFQSRLMPCWYGNHDNYAVIDVDDGGCAGSTDVHVSPVTHSAK